MESFRGAGNGDASIGFVPSSMAALFFTEPWSTMGMVKVFLESQAASMIIIPVALYGFGAMFDSVAVIIPFIFFTSGRTARVGRTTHHD
jgi:hypothetical protein